MHHQFPLHTRRLKPLLLCGWKRWVETVARIMTHMHSIRGHGKRDMGPSKYLERQRGPTLTKKKQHTNYMKKKTLSYMIGSKPAISRFTCPPSNTQMMVLFID